MMNVARATRKSTKGYWVTSNDKEIEVPRYSCRPGESVTALAKKLGLRDLSRAERREPATRDAVVALIDDGAPGGILCPCVEA